MVDVVYRTQFIKFVLQLFVKFKITDQYLEVGMWKVLVFCVVTPR